MRKIAIAALVVAAVGVAVFTRSVTSPADVAAISAPLSKPSNASVIVDERPAAQEGPSSNGETTPKPACFSQYEMESHPMFADEAARLEATSLSGTTMDGYRELDEAALESLSIQRDSAAMAVLGARKLLGALGDDPNSAVNLLKGEYDFIWKPLPRPLPNKIRESANAARHWFYQSALHGRVDALRYFAFTTELFDGGAVELGWVDSATYDSLSNGEKTALMPSNVYNMARLNIVPELDEGPVAEMTRSLVPSTERSVQIINKVTEKFLLDLQAAGLPRPSVRATTLPRLPEIMSMLCEEDRKRLEPMVNY